MPDDRWWVLHDSNLRRQLARVEAGEITAAEAYADLSEHSYSDLVNGQQETTDA